MPIMCTMFYRIEERLDLVLARPSFTVEMVYAGGARQGGGGCAAWESSKGKYLDPMFLLPSNYYLHQ